MIIDVKYNLGDNIRYIERKRHETYGPCPCCNQVGEIIGVDGKKYECPNCGGSGEVFEGMIESKEEKTGTIQSFIVSYHSDMECYHEKPWIYYTTPHSSYHIMQDDIIEKVYSKEE